MGYDVNLATLSDLTYTGTIGAGDSSVLTFNQLANERNGRIQAKTIEAPDQENLTIRAATIEGEAVTLRAGRVVVLARSQTKHNLSIDLSFGYLPC